MLAEPGFGEVVVSIREKRWQETHDKLLHEGIKAFARYGVAGTRAADVARAAGVAVGTLYFHFGDKEGLLREILQKGSDGLMESVSMAHADELDDVSAALRSQIEAMVDFVDATCPLSRIIFDPRLIETRSLDLEERLIEQQEATIRAWQQRGMVRSDVSPGLAARARVGMLMSVMAWWCRNRRRTAREEVIETLVRLCSNGFMGPCHCQQTQSTA